MRAVILVVALALRALEASPDLSTDANTITDFAGCHGISNLDGLADDLVADADGQRCLAPSSINCVDIGTADTAALDFDIDVIFAELLGFELRTKVSPFPVTGQFALTSCLWKSVQFFWSLIMKPSKVSG